MKRNATARAYLDLLVDLTGKPEKTIKVYFYTKRWKLSERENVLEYIKHRSKKSSNFYK